MSLLTIVLILAIVGVILWAVLQLPIAPPFKNIILAIVCVFMLFWVLQTLGLTDTNLRLK